MKKCRSCGETKEPEEFSNKKKTKDGKQPYCKVCARTKTAEWRRKNREKVNAYNAEWRKNNSDYHAEWRAKAQACVYRIKNKVSGSYYIGQTTGHFSVRVSNHFSPKCCLKSPFTGLNKDEWNCEVLCYGTKEEVKHLEKVLLNTRVGQDPLCLNKNT